MVFLGGKECDVGRASDEEGGAEAATEGERDGEQERPECSPGSEIARRRSGAREGVGEDAAVRGQRSGGDCYAGRARCLNAFTSSSGAASG